jgi:Cu-Zn family superoxide dismutase
MRAVRIAVTLSTGLVAAACATTGPRDYRATAVLEPTKGSETTGTITFLQRGDRTIIYADVRGLKANQEHGFHVHEKGDCSSGDGMSAGGHFNPDNVAHAGQPGHAGDMPNLKADANGIAHAQFESKTLTVAQGPHSIVGKGLIVHRDADDYKTQPTGNAGPRLACSVIKAG